MLMKEMPLHEFAALTASNEPAPGGGSIAAMSAAFAAALSEMVANLTLGKKGYETVQAEMESLLTQAAPLREALLDDIERDCACFNAFMDALRMPKENEEQKSERSAAMQNALKTAAEAPMEIAQKAASIFPLAEAVVKSGNRNAVTDGLVSAMLARTAVLSALLNVKINLASIKDEAYVFALHNKCQELTDYAVSREAAILALCPDLA